MKTAMPYDLLSWAFVLVTISVASAKGDITSSSHQIHKRGYTFHRRPYDLLEPQQPGLGWNSLFQQQRQHISGLLRSSSTPTYRISDLGSNMTLEMILPGFCVDELTIEVEERPELVLHIRGMPLSLSASLDYFDLKFDLPKDCLQVDKISATLSNGILRVVVPKQEKVVRRLEINVP